MEADRWEQVERLFEEARAVPPDERAAFLRAHCDDRAVRAEVDSLLDAREEAPSFFEAAAEQIVVPALDEFEGAGVPDGTERGTLDLAGQHVGPYRLVEKIGVGGMSVVYRAERARGDYEQTVAVKLLQRRLQAEAVEERFRAERQVLASLDHPNIAQLVDGGVAEGGRPYLVMEHVDGVPLTTYAEERDLGLEVRLDLLAQVFGAVQAAHRQLVVHRDLKPSNVLVTETGAGDLQVKLLDFGIAKLLGEALPVIRPETRTGRHLMTPAYAAPEQVTGEEITTATDVYQLGVLAYELLAGTRPFDVADESLMEIERSLLEDEPRKPSGEAERFADRLRGDLDRIVLKALRKEPGRRYRSVEALAADLERYRKGEPVEARPATLGYRAKKFVARHRPAVTAGILIVLLGMAYAGTVTVQANRLAEQRDRAQREAQTAEEVSEMLVGLFEASSPYEQPDTLTARMLLRRGEDRISQLEDQPAAQAQLLGAMGRAHQELGDYERADSLLGQARGLRSRLYDPPHPELATSLDDYAEVQRIRGQYARADSLHTKALAMRREVHNPPHSKIAESLHNLASVKRDKGELPLADSLHREGLAMRRNVYEEGHLKISSSLTELGFVLRKQGKYEEADSLYRKSLAIKREQLEPRHPQTASTLMNLGVALRKQGAYAAADSVYREALTIQREHLEPRHPSIATTLNNLGVVWRKQGRYAAADSIYRKALAIRRKKLGPKHPETSIVLNNIGAVLYYQDRYAAADSVYREVLSIRREQLGPQHPKTATTLSNLGVVSRKQGEYALADSIYREALAIRREKLGRGHPRVATTLNNLGYAFLKQDEYALADSIYREALAIRRENLGRRHPRTARILNSIGHVAADQGRSAAAESAYREALAIRRGKLGPRHPNTIATLYNLGGELHEQGKYASADSVYRHVLSAQREHFGPRHFRVANTHHTLGLSLQKQGEYAAAEHHFRKALTIRRSTYREDHPDVREALEDLAELYEVWGKSTQAQSYRNSLLEAGGPSLEP